MAIINDLSMSNFIMFKNSFTY